ncbi:MAG: hypothetical protein K6E20_00135 [Acholeplasmatales bacterium]|nr:hypothetical protein [Acholeplasmatales bacterium]
MKPCYIDIHIHTSENANNLNKEYDVDTLKNKIELAAGGNNYLISLTDHNTINEDAYEKMIQKGINFIVGVELHVKNYEKCPAYHCHFFFKTDKSNCLNTIKDINKKLDELYPNKVPELLDENIPTLAVIIKKLEGYDYLILPHGGQAHGVFNESIPKEGIQFNDVMERSIYYNLFDGFTARSNKKLEISNNYFKKLGIDEFINLVTCTDNYSISKYPNGKTTTDDFIPTWMYSSATFDGFRIALSEKERFSYGAKPKDNFQDEILSVKLNEEGINIDVNLEPGLNVVIGNSSSGKTLFVDSLYKKISGEISTDYQKFNVGNIIVENPSGMVPHYFSQNYIMDLVKKDDEKGVDNNLADNKFLKRIFPFDKNFEQQITKTIADFRLTLTTFINSAKNVKETIDKIKSLPNFSRLFYLGEKLINPIKIFKPNKEELEKLKLTDETKKDIEKLLKDLNDYQYTIAFFPNIQDELNSIKKKICKTYDMIEFASKVNDIIIRKSDRIDESLKSTNAKNIGIDLDKAKLLEYLGDLVKHYDSFWMAYNKIITYSVEFKSKTIESAGHSLTIRNDFKITKKTFIDILNKYLKDKINNDCSDVTQLFEENYSKRNPKVIGYSDLIEKIMADFSGMNHVLYEIVHKDGRKFSELSPGLRTSVILDIILGYDKDKAPLIIDQPEDNLATNYINGDLVDAIKRSKTNRQIIIVTHNATIPMLGDAQNIVYCINDGNRINIKSYKMEDSFDAKNTILDVIADVTDGGKSSVKKRFKKYNLKSYRKE